MLKQNRKPASLTREWSKAMPGEPGVYAWFEGNNLIYVGESGLLCDRLDDARRTYNHTLRRSLGRTRFSKLKHYRPATGSKKFPANIEKRLDDLMKTLTVSVVPVPFGRTEVEEYMKEKYGPMHNDKYRRGT